MRRGQLYCAKKCSKVCSGDHEMKWILERNYSDDCITICKPPKDRFPSDFSSWRSSTQMYWGGTNHQSRMIGRTTVEREPPFNRFDTFMQNIYAYKSRIQTCRWHHYSNVPVSQNCHSQSSTRASCGQK